MSHEWYSRVMATPTLVITDHDTVETLRTILKHTSDGAEKTRLKAIIKAKEGLKRSDIAVALLVCERSVGLWVKAYNTGGSAGLKTKPPGRKPGPQKWDAPLFDDLAREIDKGGYWSIPRMQEWLTKHKQVDIPEQTVWYRMNQLNYSYKSARPHPVQGNKERQDTFKKGVSLRSSRR